MVEVVGVLLPVVLRAIRLGLGLVLGLAAVKVVRNYRRSRTAPYFILRRAAAVRARRWLLAFLGAGAALAVSMRVRPPLAAETASAPAAVASAEATPAPVRPASVTVPPTPTLTVGEVPGEGPASPIATQVSPVTPSPVFATRESEVTPGAEASISITAVSTDISEDFLPRNPGSEFRAGVSRFYVFFDFEGMSDGVSWSGVVLVNGQAFQPAGFDRLWSMGREGENLYWWFDRDDGWPAGQYEVRFYVGDSLADAVSFRMVEAVATVETTP